jgi:hypothetical protein
VFRIFRGSLLNLIAATHSHAAAGWDSPPSIHSSRFPFASMKDEGSSMLVWSLESGDFVFA